MKTVKLILDRNPENRLSVRESRNNDITPKEIIVNVNQIATLKVTGERVIITLIDDHYTDDIYYLYGNKNDPNLKDLLKLL